MTIHRSCQKNDSNLSQKSWAFFLYYAIAIYNTVLVDLSDIGSEQSRATSKTMDEVQQLLDYLASNPNAIIQYHASGMILFIHSDASYLSVTKARSISSGVFFLSDPKPDAITFSEYTPILNGFIFIMCKFFMQHHGFSSKGRIWSTVPEWPSSSPN